VVKTKFDSILKIKKVKVEEIENRIAKLNSQIELLNSQLSQTERELKEMHYPIRGNFALISQFKLLQNSKLNEISNIKSELQQLFIKKEKLILELKEAKLEYEKIDYLRKEEISKYIKKEKEREKREIDEIAIMLHKRGI
jgi:chaperonin cofactor prefoldin